MARTLPTHPLAKMTVFFPWLGNNPNHHRANTLPGAKEITLTWDLLWNKVPKQKQTTVTSADSKSARSHLVQPVTPMSSFHGAVTYPHRTVTYSGSRSTWCKSTSFFAFELEPYPLMAAPCTEVLLYVWEGPTSEEKTEGSSLTMG